MNNLFITLMQPTLLGWLLKATVLLMLALAATSLLRRASAGTRHLVWLATLAGVLVLPLVSAWAPLRLAIVPVRLIPVLPSAAVTAAPSIAPALGSVPDFERTTTESPVTSHAPLGTVSPLASHEPRVPFWAMLLAVWGAVALGLFGWLGFGALSVRRMVRTGRALDDERAWTGPLCEIADRLDLDQVPRLISSPIVEMPFACGVLEPTIVLPASAEQWSDSRRRAVLFHELAHVKRRDLAGHTLGRVACALYWFHPLVWTAARRLRAESERACDDLVLSCGARASDYADHLLDIVISVRHQGAPATAMPMARRRELEGRVLAILDPAVARIGPGRLQSATMLVGIGALALSVAAMAPRRVEGRGQRAEGIVPRADGRVPSVKTAVASAAKPIAPKASPRPSPSPTATPSPLAAPSPGATSTLVLTTTPPDEGLTTALGTIGRFAVQKAAAALSSAAGGKTMSVRGTEGVDSAKVALLLRVLRSDPDASVRRMAAWGLSEAGDALGSVDALAVAVRSDDDENVREMAAWALSDSRSDVAHRALAAALRRDASDQVRETAVWALGNTRVRDEDRDVIETALTSDASDEVRESAAWALGYTPRRPAGQALVAALGDKTAEVRETAAWALAEIGDEDVAPAVTAAFKRETNAEVRMEELRALTFMHVDDRTVLDAALSSKDADVRARAVRMLAGSGGSWPEPRPRPRPRPMP